ncbi:MAG TPA: GspMb/PilO family protein [Gemmatimonadaceae bacterium]|nr:GspMb/PilO family protein [Gemmatimonadaceae bacterium]
MKRAFSSLSPRDRRALAIGVMSIGGLVIVGRVLPDWRDWQEAAVASATKAARSAARGQVLAKDARAIHDSLAARRARLTALAPTWLSGDSPAAAGAGLAAVITRAATDAAMTLGTLDIATDSAGQTAFVPVHVRVSVSGDIQGLAMLLAALDRGPVALNVASLDVQGGDASAPSQRPEVLHTDLTIEALWCPHAETGGGR